MAKKKDVAFGRRLKALRASRGWTQDQLAEVAGVSTALVRSVESGRKPHSDNLELLADAYGVSVDALLGREPVTLAPDSTGAFRSSAA